MTASPGSIGSSGSNGGKAAKWVPYIVAFVILIVFSFFVYYMLNNTGLEEREWTRAVYIFSGVEAIAFAATGFLFGKEVHRAQAENAEKRAGEAQTQKADAEQKALQGTLVAGVVDDKIKTLMGKIDKIEKTSNFTKTAPKILLRDEVGSVKAELDEISKLNKRLF